MEARREIGKRARTAGTVDAQLRLGPPGSAAETKYVKVIVPGGAFNRMLDLRTHKGYAELNATVFGLVGEPLGLVVAFEDEAGNVKLATGLPWEMFVGSCKKLLVCKRGLL